MNDETALQNETTVEYEAPQIEEVMTAETLEREVAYAGNGPSVIIG